MPAIYRTVSSKQYCHFIATCGLLVPCMRLPTWCQPWVQFWPRGTRGVLSLQCTVALDVKPYHWQLSLCNSTVTCDLVIYLLDFFFLVSSFAHCHLSHLKGASKLEEIYSRLWATCFPQRGCGNLLCLLDLLDFVHYSKIHFYLCIQSMRLFRISLLVCSENIMLCDVLVDMLISGLYIMSSFPLVPNGPVCFMILSRFMILVNPLVLTVFSFQLWYPYSPLIY